MSLFAQQVDVTETNKIVSITRKDIGRPVVFIQWFIGRLCQYECQYCSPEWHSKTASNWSLDQLKQAWINLCKANEHRPNLGFKIAISGGEPTMNPDLLPWLKWLDENYKEKLLYISVATNATATLEYYKELSKYLSSIIFSIHSEYTAEKRFFNLVADVDKYTKENNSCVTSVLVPMEKWHTERSLQYVTYLTSLGIDNRLFPLHDFNPDKKPRQIMMRNRMDFDEKNNLNP